MRHRLVNKLSLQPFKNFLILSILVVTAIKLSLIGSGFLSFLDEFRYTYSGKALQYLSELKVSAAINALFLTQGRPAEAIINIFPNAIQLATANIFNLNYYESLNSFPLFVFNFIIHCSILIVHFKFSKLVFKDFHLALVSVLLFGTLTNSYIYIRHALPYDASLLIFYLVIFKMVKYTQVNMLTFQWSFLLGIFSFLGYLVYPGYFPLFVFCLIILFFNNLSKENTLRKAYNSGYFLLGSFTCLVFFEVFSRFGGHSYILDAIALSGTVIQGSFEESYTFIIKYLFEVEGLTGIVIVLSLSFSCTIMLHQFRNKTYLQNPLVLLIALSIFGLFIAYASAGYFFHKMVLYGRLLHQYLPFICIVSLFPICQIKRISYNRLVLLIISIVFIVNFGLNFTSYKSLAYPRDVAWKLNATIYIEDIENVCELNNSWSMLPSYKEYAHSDVHIKRDNRQLHSILITNCCAVCSGVCPEIYSEFIPDSSYHLLETNPHFINFKAYQYEGYNIIDRQNIDKINLQIRVFSKKSNKEVKKNK